MGVSLEELWKGAPDDAIVDAASKWSTLNAEGQRVILAEAKRRGLKVAAPNGNGTAHAGSEARSGQRSDTAAEASTAKVNMKIWLLVAIVVGAVAVIGVFT